MTFSKHCHFSVYLAVLSTNMHDKNFISFHFCSDSSVSSTQSGWEVIMECYNNRGRFLIEAILWWLIIALPINLASIFFSIQAPAYIHTDHINNGTNDFNTSLGIMISYSKIQFAVFFILLYRIHWMVSRIFYNYESKTFARN